MVRTIYSGKLLFSISVFVTLAAAFIAISGNVKKIAPVFHSSEEILRPYLWFDYDDSDESFQKELDYGDPMRVTSILMKDWAEHRDPVKTRERVSKVVSKWKLEERGAHLNYTFAYEKLKPGWYSGMDSWSFPLFLVGVWQETGEVEYLRLAKKLIRQASTSVEDGGTVWYTDRGCWFSEYAWKGMRLEDEFYVLNGHLYALQAVYMLGEALRDTRLQSLYRCGVRATKYAKDDFIRPNAWPRYMLNPSTINPTHYLIYETMQFAALHEIHPDPFFLEQSQVRREVLKQAFPVLTRGTSTLTLSLIGPPHPYVIDTYALRIDCHDDASAERYFLPAPSDSRVAVIDRAILNRNTRLDPTKTRCRLTSLYGNQKFALYEGVTKPLTGKIPPGTPINATSEALFDAWSLEVGRVVVDPARRHNTSPDADSYLDTQGRLVLTPEAPISFGAMKLLGIEFAADGPLRLGVTLHSKGRDFFRYYPATPAGDRLLVLLSPLGFDDGEEIDSIERVTVFFYTHQQESPITLTRAGLRLFENGAELYEYFDSFRPEFLTE